MKLISSIFFVLLYINCCSQAIFTDNSKSEYCKMLRNYKIKDTSKIDALVIPYIKIDTVFGAVKIGDSKFGGMPDLPEIIHWPMYKDSAMIFLGQINLSQASKYDYDDLLPKSGILYFFAYFDKPINEYGCEFDYLFPKDRYKCIYYDSENIDIRNVEYPKNLYKEYQFREYKIDFQLKYKFEDYYSINRNLDSTEELIINDFENDYGQYIYQNQMLLGHPCPWQDDVTFDWALNYYNYTYLEYEKFKSKYKPKQLRDTFCNLLSFDFETYFGRIGDSHCFIGITKDDLRKRKFENAILVFQGT